MPTDQHSSPERQGGMSKPHVVLFLFIAVVGCTVATNTKKFRDLRSSMSPDRVMDVTSTSPKQTTSITLDSTTYRLDLYFVYIDGENRMIGAGVNGGAYDAGGNYVGEGKGSYRSDITSRGSFGKYLLCYRRDSLLYWDLLENLESSNDSLRMLLAKTAKDSLK